MSANHVWALVLMYGHEDVTADCIASLTRQDHAELTILLIDNDASDGGGARLRARFPQIRYLDTGGNVGFTGGMNRGLAHALEHGADDVLFLNNDTVLEPTCVSTLLRARKALPDAGIVAPKILYGNPPLLWYAGGDLSRARAIAVHRHFLEPDRPGEDRIERVTFASGCGFMMPASVARRVGGFAEDFFIYCEDVDLCMRLDAAGYGIYYVPAARMEHRHTPAPEPSPFEIRHRDRNRRRIARRSYGQARRLVFAAWFYPTRAVYLTRYLVRGDRARVAATLRGIFEA